MGVGEFIVIALLIVVWIVPAVLVGRYAARKGYSYELFALFAIFVSFFVAWFVAYLLPPRGAQSVSELERLSRLHAAGSLTDDEFAQAKARSLGG